MMATRPPLAGVATSSSSSATVSAAASGSREEKRIPGVPKDALKEERRPLLDLEDVEQMNRELSACFGAPPPPPLTMHGDDPPQPAAATLRAEEETLQGAAPTAMGRAASTDFSSLYSTDDGARSGQLYPAFIPSAPSTDAVRAQAQVMVATETSRDSSVAAPAKRERMAAAEVGGGKGKGESQEEVVEELLSENERLRIIITDMTEELEHLSSKLREQEGRVPGTGATSVGAAPARGANYPQQQQAGGAGAAASSSQADSRAPPQHIHIKCENCPQWLQIPTQAQLVYCPSCTHTSQITSNTQKHVPASTLSTARNSTSSQGLFDFVKSIFQ
ncbi:unnamed protein product [Discosporangium mesarthrocarpum]